MCVCAKRTGPSQQRDFGRLVAFETYGAVAIATDIAATSAEARIVNRGAGKLYADLQLVSTVSVITPLPSALIVPFQQLYHT